MSEPEKTTKVVQIYDQPVEVSLIRGAKGQYRWSINVKAESPLAALRQVQDIDAELRHRYAAVPGFELGESKPQASCPEDPHARMEKTVEDARKAGERGPQLGEQPWGK
jgi:hypothetical protein